MGETPRERGGNGERCSLSDSDMMARNSMCADTPVTEFWDGTKVPRWRHGNVVGRPRWFVVYLLQERKEKYTSGQLACQAVDSEVSCA